MPVKVGSMQHFTPILLLLGVLSVGCDTADVVKVAAKTSSTKSKSKALDGAACLAECLKFHQKALEYATEVNLKGQKEMHAKGNACQARCEAADAKRGGSGKKRKRRFQKK